jgi:hypothetical protein
LVQASLQQWDWVFAHVKKKRREYVVYFTDPRVDYLFGDESCFTNSKEAREIHFTAVKKNLADYRTNYPKKTGIQIRIFLLPKKEAVESTAIR